MGIWPRQLAIGVVVAIGLAACSAGGDPAPESANAVDATPAASVALEQVRPSPPEDGPSALDDMNDPAFPDPLVDPELIRSGGPPPDGIPAIDEPRFERASDVDWLADTEGVLSLTVEGETRAYPIQVMTWHEIVNDTVGGVPVAATYCPLCNSGLAFDRRLDDRVLSFGTSGRLYSSNLVMYDRQTESLWPQLTGQASVGVLTGATLTSYPMGAVGWSEFREAFPDAWVLSRDTGYRRDYGVNPYTGYDSLANEPIFPGAVEDRRLPAKTRVIALPGEHESVTVLRDAVARDGVRETTVDGHDVVLWYETGQASALDKAAIAGGKEIGTVAAFDPVVDGQTLTFTAAADGFTDTETGSTWNILGQAVDGPLEGARLRAVPFFDTFWFTWVGFQPDTRLVAGLTLP